MTGNTILVAGGGGFIGGHLVSELRKQDSANIRSVDIKPLDEWYQVFDDVENIQADLRLRDACDQACDDADVVYNLACDMGGMGFIELNKALCMRSVLINTHLLEAGRRSACERFFFSSTACVYRADKQDDPDVPALKEEDAYPAMACFYNNSWRYARSVF